MLSLHQTVLLCSIYVLISILCGCLFSVFIPSGKICRQISGFAMEFSSGFTVSVIFLSLIPTAYSFFGAAELLVFLIPGIITAMLLQEKLKYKNRIMSDRKRLFATEKLAIFSFAACSTVQGFSVGTGFGFSSCLGLGLGIASAIKAFPEAVAIFLMNKSVGGSVFYRALICVLLILPFFTGTVLGVLFASTDDIITLRMLVFSSGMTLYTAVGDMSIESKLLYHGRFLPIFNLGGMLCATMLILMN